MMRTILFAALLTLGCGSAGVDELDTEIEGDSVQVVDDGEFTTITIGDSFADLEELGSLEQPLSVPIQYGGLNAAAAAAESRCQGTPANDFCIIPRDKSLRFCNSLPFGGFGTPDYFGAATTAISQSAATVSSRGWAISSACASPQDTFEAENGECGSTNLACAQVKTLSNDAGVFIRGLRYRKYVDSPGAFCRIFVDFARLEATIAGLPEADKQAHRSTVMRHEIGHCMGLGHNSSTTGNDRLMGSGVFPSPALHFSAAELAQLRDYIP